MARWCSPATTWARSTTRSRRGDSLHASPRCSSATPSGSRRSRRATPTTASSRTSCWCPAAPHYSMHDMTVTWPRAGRRHRLGAAARRQGLPQPQRLPGARWPSSRTTRAPGRLIGTVPNATSCHKPATVSGGGKSEISKAITDAFIVGSAFIAELRDRHGLGHRDPRPRLLRGASSTPSATAQDLRPILSRDRSIGSVIKLLTPSRSEYTAEYNAWLSRIPPVRQGARLRRQALLPPGVGRRLAPATSASPRSTAGRATRCTSTAPRSPSTCCASATTSTGRGACSACATTSRPR